MTPLWLVFIMLVSGHVAGRIRAFPENAPDVLNTFVIYVSLPAVVLHVVPRIALSPGLSVLVVVPWVLLAALAPLVVLLGKKVPLPAGVTAALLLSVPLGNTSFLGFPLLGALLGQGALGPAAIYDQIGSFSMLATYGLVVAARYSGSEASPRAMLERLVSFPPFLALVLGFLPIPWPPFLDSLFVRVGDTLVPIAMFAVGLRVRLRPPTERGALVLGLALKMVVAPLLAWGLCRSLGVSRDLLRVAVLESGMPPMISAGALAMFHGFAPELSAALVGYGIPLSMITVPLLSRWLG